VYGLWFGFEESRGQGPRVQRFGFQIWGLGCFGFGVLRLPYALGVCHDLIKLLRLHLLHGLRLNPKPKLFQVAGCGGGVTRPVPPGFEFRVSGSGLMVMEGFRFRVRG
jgi:hypothetical protein